MIGIFGGTFDPVHYGHLRAALELLEGLGLNEVRFIPARIPPHRDRPGATPEQRLAMLQVATQDQMRFRVDARELEREGPSFMVETLSTLRDELGDLSLCLILGEDAFQSLNTWYRWDELLELAHLVIMNRPGTGPFEEGPVQKLLVEHETEHVSELRACRAGRVLRYSVTPLKISATAIRRLLSRGRSARYLTPDSVLQIAESAEMYKETQGSV